MKKILSLFAVLVISCNTKSSYKAEEMIVADTIPSEKIAPKKDEKKARELSQLFRVKRDEFEGIEWITPKSAPMYNNYKGLYCYFAVKGLSASNFRFVLQYVSEDWLFIDSAKFLVDGQVFEYFPSQVKRDNGSGEIWEWWDEGVKAKDVSLLKAICDSKSAQVKLNGSQYFNVVKITNKQKQDIKNTLEYYQALGGTFE